MRLLLLMVMVAACMAAALSAPAQGKDGSARVGWAGVTLRLPGGWHAIPLALPPGIPIDVDPVARIVAASGPVGFGKGCGEFPYSFPSTGVALVVMEWIHGSQGVFRPRPARFTSRTLPIRAPPAVECFNGPAGSVQFTDRGRRFDAFLLLGRHASLRLAACARAVLDTLRVTKARR